MTIRFTMEIKKKEDFDNTVFIQIITQGLLELGIEDMRYIFEDNKYRFEVTFDSLVPEIEMRSVLGVFSNISNEYDRVSVYSITVDSVS